MKRIISLCLLASIILTGCQKGNIEGNEGNQSEVEDSEHSIDIEGEYNSRSITSDEFSSYKQSFIEAYCNDATVIALTESRDVITWGNNYNGKIGNGEIETHTTDTQVTPVEPYIIDFAQNITSVGNSYHTSYAITDSGEVYMWGRNDFGETGIVSGNILEPKKLNIKQKIEKIASGNTTNLFLTRDGKVLVSGIDMLLYDNIDDLNENVAYKINLEISEEPVPSITADPGYSEINLPFICKDLSIGLLHYSFLSEKGEVYIQGTLLGDYNKSTPNITHNELYKINFPEEIIDIESSSNFIVALSATGKMYLYGRRESVFFDDNSDKEISDNVFIKDGIDNIVSISCDTYCVAVVDISGNAWGFGIDNLGVIDIKNCDIDGYETITEFRKLDYSDVKSCVVERSNTVIITNDNRIFIQGSDGVKQITFLDY